MAVLSDVDLRKVMAEDEGIIILNMREKSITGAGYDLTIGFICDSETGKEPETYEEDPGRYVLLAGHRYLVISKEFLYLSSQYMATLHSRGSYALKGIIVSSTIIDPNYVGFITGSLYNCTLKNVYIKKDSQFATVVFHELLTPTETVLQKNEFNRAMDAQETLHSKYSNINKTACDAGDVYYAKARKEIEYEYEAVKRRTDEKKMIKEMVSNTMISSGEDLSLQRASEEILHRNRQRVRITFLIGNGFDLNVGLNTRYADFYKYYIDKNNDDLLAKEIKENINDWADLELALGKYTEKVKNKEEFWKSEKILENCLVDFLEEQMNRINIKNERKRRDIAFKIGNSLTNFYEDFQETLKLHIKKILKENKEHGIEYAFITFNYTDALDQCLEAVKKQFIIEFCPDINETSLHIHGTTMSGKIVLGVNDESQIINKEFRNNSSDRQRFVKKEIIEYYGNENQEKAHAIIDNSSIVCIFGMSIGATDKAWWKYIAKWLQNDKDRRLLIFARDDEAQKIEKYTNECEKDTKSRFKNHGELSDVWKQIENQIYVKVNSDIFNFKIV